MKKLVSLLCAVAVFIGAFTVQGFAISKQEVPAPYSIYEVEAGLVPESFMNRNALVSPRREKAGVVCVMRIYSDTGTEPSSSAVNLDFGHTFLTFMNASSGAITVGRHTVAPKKMISVGKFGNLASASGNNYRGIFYNVEAQRARHNQWYGPDKSIYYELTSSELATVNRTLLQLENDYSEAGNNCCTTAAKIWNSVLSTTDYRYIERFGTPALVYYEIAETGYSIEGNKLISADYNRCYYYSGKLWEFADPQVRN